MLLLSQVSPICVLSLKRNVSFYRAGLNYSLCDRERSVLVLKVSFFIRKAVLGHRVVFLPASAHGTPWSFLKEMTSQDISDSRPQSPERGLSDGEGAVVSQGRKVRQLGLSSSPIRSGCP